MKKTSKWLSMLCALILLIGLTACENTNAPESSAPDSTPDVSDTTGVDSVTTTSTDSCTTDPTDEVSGTSEGSTTTTSTPTTTTTTTPTTKTSKTTNTTTKTTTKTTTQTTQPTTTFTTQPYDGPVSDAYLLVAVSALNTANRSSLSYSFSGESDVYQDGDFAPYREYSGSAIVSPEAELSTPRSIQFSSMMVDGFPTMNLCQHGDRVYYSYNEYDKSGNMREAKKTFTSKKLEGHLALVEASAVEFVHLPSPAHFVDATIEASNRYPGEYLCVTISVPDKEFAGLFTNSIRFSGAMFLEEGRSLQYTVSNASVEYIIHPEGYLYDMRLRYDVKTDGKSFRFFSGMRFNVNNTAPHSCAAPEDKAYVTVPAVEWVDYTALK